MLPSQRDAAILSLLQQQQIITIAEICTLCNCSAVTARRDLARLEEQGHLRRAHGSATRGAGPVPEPCGPVNVGALEARLAMLDRSDALIVTPNNASALRLLVERADRAGVPIIAEAIKYPGARTVVAIDDYCAGVELGHWLGAYVRDQLEGDPKILELAHSLPNTEARVRGFEKGLRDLLPNIPAALRVDSEGLRSPARAVVADALIVHPDVNIIFAINDATALGAADACRAAGVDERQLVIVWFGLEGKETRDLLAQGGSFRACVAMFPEVVGRACLDAAVCICHDCAIPERITTPFAILTSETLERFYTRDLGPEGWTVNWHVVKHLPTASPGYSMLSHPSNCAQLARVGWLQIFSSHDWYRSVRRAMQARSCKLGISLEVLDASQDMAQEVEALKRIIGCTAARLVKDGDTIILDGGAATFYMAQALRGHQDITVITNSVAVLSVLSEEAGITLLSSGGAVRAQSRVLAGPSAEATFHALRADKAFIGGAGLSQGFGLSDTNVQEAGVKQAMLSAAREVILLADHTTIGAEALIRIAPIESVHHLVTDAGISPHDRMTLTQSGIEVTIAEENGKEVMGQ